MFIPNYKKSVSIGFYKFSVQSYSHYGTHLAIWCKNVHDRPKTFLFAPIGKRDITACMIHSQRWHCPFDVRHLYFNTIMVLVCTTDMLKTTFAFGMKLILVHARVGQ